MLPFISIVVPLYNEESCIERLTRSILDQDYPADRYEVLMADGGSTDRTLEALQQVDTAGRVRVLRNPGRTAPSGLNVLLEAARGDIVTRIDGHSFIAPDYLQQIARLMEETGAKVVGGPVRMMAETPFQIALVEALYSRIGVGSVPYRTLNVRTAVESLQTGSFRREVLEKVGRFDESLAVVEDLDLNTRIREAGYALILDPAIRFWYIPRTNLRRLWEQIHSVGRMKPRVLSKHTNIIKLKYLLPTMFVTALAVAIVALASGLWSLMVGGTGAGPYALGGALFIASYAIVISMFAISRVPRIGIRALRLLVIVPTLHLGYGTGFVLGLVDLALQRSPKHLRGIG